MSRVKKRYVLGSERRGTPKAVVLPMGKGDKKMNVELLSDSAEIVVKVGAVDVPLRVERDEAKKIVRVGVVAKLTHTPSDGVERLWTTGVWVEASEFRNADGSPKGKLAVATALRDKVVTIRTAKQAEWDAIPANPVPETLP